ncbi:hypothetical protein X801_04402 [Opisthorchis viverrini]|uniref:Tetratricopeptide repeat protein n=1 Tax=Opisthorchis viverrini TaxID=6198 RepID=A0A1S8WZ96_OPIVI|nr:hypothetical protein X801_04402 [Opisthorchis viverrini]
MRAQVPDTERKKSDDILYRSNIGICTGVQLAKESGNVALQKECADILEQTKQWQEAASLYETAACYEAAITVYLRCKNFRRAGDLLRRVANAPRLQLQYAKAREADGAYKEAVVAYEAAHDWDSVAR